MSNKFLVYFAVPVTLLTIVYWFVWNRMLLSRAKELNKGLERRPILAGLKRAPRRGLSRFL
jgi:hypothetical protein